MRTPETTQIILLYLNTVQQTFTAGRGQSRIVIELLFDLLCIWIIIII